MVEAAAAQRAGLDNALIAAIVQRTCHHRFRENPVGDLLYLAEAASFGGSAIMWMHLVRLVGVAALLWPLAVLAQPAAPESAKLAQAAK